MKLLYSEFNNNPFELHRLALDEIKPKDIVLDVGCASGAFAGKVKSIGCKVYGLELNKEAIKQAKKVCEKVEIVDLDKITEIPFGLKFDVITIMEVIEHLRNPENLLNVSQKYLKPNGKIIISTPNISYFNIRFLHLFGSFDYTDTGILDKTHVHFYTKKSLLALLSQCKLTLEKYSVTSVLRNLLFVGRYINIIPKFIQFRISNKFDTLLGYQFVAVCKKRK